MDKIDKYINDLKSENMENSHMPPKKKGSPDNFQTPAIAILPLIPYLKREWTIWECAQGKGNLTKALEKEGFRVIGSDIIDGVDFLKSNVNYVFDCIITNPPYSLKDEFLERAYEIGKPFALLMPLTALEGKKRQGLYKRYGLQLMLLNRRINFETPSGNGSGSWFATAWFTFGLHLPKDIVFADLPK
ncbi:MAG: class I SAM-dependent methyltransferase [Thermoplasmata archaeon]